MKPKQFRSVVGDKTLLQLTVDRVSKIPGKNNVMLVTLEQYSQEARRQLPDLPSEHIVLEPYPRNTCACVCLCALLLAEGFMDSTPDDIMVICPSDHHVSTTEKFIDAIMIAVEVASEPGKVATIGIKPNRPETAYGYIKVCRSMRLTHNGGLYYVGEKFVEKPDLATASSYLRTGEYFWNSGIFVWRVDTILDLISKHMSETYSVLCNSNKRDLKQLYKSLDPISIDYGVMENLDEFAVVPAQFEWDDLGSWAALERVVTQDRFGNAIKGKAFLAKSNGCLIWAETKPVISIGVSDLIIVESEEAVLICAKDKADHISEFSKKIRCSDEESTI